MKEKIDRTEFSLHTLKTDTAYSTMQTSRLPSPLTEGKASGAENLLFFF